MKICNCIFFFLLFLLFTFSAFAGQTVLTTYYPPPTAAYNKVKLATNFTAAYTNSDPNAYCTPLNTGIIFVYKNTKTLYKCPSTYIGPYGISNPVPAYCSDPGNAGAILADSLGVLHVCMNNQDTIYPQQCYNDFCSYDITQHPTCDADSTCTCKPYMIGTINQKGACSSGFIQMPVDSTKVKTYDTFQTSAQISVVSIVCCTASYNSTAATPDTGSPNNETLPIP